MAKRHDRVEAHRLNRKRTKRIHAMLKEKPHLPVADLECAQCGARVKKRNAYQYAHGHCCSPKCVSERRRECDS